MRSTEFELIPRRNGRLSPMNRERFSTLSLDGIAITPEGSQLWSALKLYHRDGDPAVCPTGSSGDGNRAAPADSPARPRCSWSLISYSSKTGLLLSQPSTLLSGQPTERVSMLPSLTGGGKSPDLIRRQIVVFDSPVT